MIGITYDPDANAVYISLGERSGGDLTTVVAELEEILGTAQFDFDSSKRLIGIEILDANKVLPIESIKILRRGITG